MPRPASLAPAELSTAVDTTRRAVREARLRFTTATLDIVAHVIRQWFPEATHATLNLSEMDSMGRVRLASVTHGDSVQAHEKPLWNAPRLYPFVATEDMPLMFDGDARRFVEDHLSDLTTFRVTRDELTRLGVTAFVPGSPYWRFPLTDRPA